MKYKLTLVPKLGNPADAFDMDTTKDPTQYEVLGLPPGEKALTGLCWEHRKPDLAQWRILRTINDKHGEWEGAYETAEEARSTLEFEVNLN